MTTMLERADWNNTTVVRGDVASAVHDLKRQAGQDIVLYGHGPLGQALLEARRPECVAHGSGERRSSDAAPLKRS
jgi:hypothetical protein